MITYKYIRPTKEFKGHTNVFLNDNKIGYFIPMQITKKVKGYFIAVEYRGELMSGKFPNRKEVINWIDKNIN